MNREERKRKFTEAVVNMLYPPPPAPPYQPQPEEDEEEVVKPGNNSTEAFVSDVLSDELDENGNTSVSNDDGSDFEPRKLTRVQRKRLRKKKLKEEAARRGKMIGPLSPPANSVESNDVVGKDCPPSVRQNVAGEVDSEARKQGLQLAYPKLKKLKRRRMAKRAAKEKERYHELCTMASSQGSAIKDELILQILVKERP